MDDSPILIFLKNQNLLFCDSEICKNRKLTVLSKFKWLHNTGFYQGSHTSQKLSYSTLHTWLAFLSGRNNPKALQQKQKIQPNLFKKIHWFSLGTGELNFPFFGLHRNCSNAHIPSPKSDLQIMMMMMDGPSPIARVPLWPLVMVRLQVMDKWARHPSTVLKPEKSAVLAFCLLQH